jgi:hypothetical protein
LSNPIRFRDPDGLEESDELKPDTPAHEFLYGAVELFAHTDLSIGNYMPTVLAPITSPNVSTPAKLGYAIFVAPFAIVGAGAAGVAVHVVKSTWHIGWGAVRLVGGWAANQRSTIVPLASAIHDWFSPVSVSVPNIDDKLSEETSDEYKNVENVEPPPPRSQEPKINHKRNITHGRHAPPAARPVWHGCQFFAPDAPDVGTRMRSPERLY